MTAEPTISVALVTRNRPEALRRALESLARQSPQPLEVLVSDDSDQGSVPAVQELAREFGARYLSGPRRGLYANRNAVALAAQGSHVRTMDDDHELPAGNIAACVAAVTGDPDAVWVMNEVWADDGYDERHTCPPQLHPRGYSEPPRDPDGGWPIADGASIFPASIFRRGHRFSEEFLFGPAYLEFGSYLWANGVRIRHLRSSYVIHHFDARARSHPAGDEDLGARLFAMIRHSFFDQPTTRNVTLTTAQLALMLVRQPKAVRRVLPRVKAALARRRSDPQSDNLA